MKLRQVGFILCVCASTLAASAADRTWDGGAADANWSSVNNWDGDASAPVADDALFFGGTVRLVNTNDFSADTAFAGLTFNSGAGAFVLSGRGITLGGDARNLSTSAQTINLPLTLSGTRMFYGSNAAFTVNGAISGPGGLIANVTNNTFYLTASNSYEGVTIVTNGGLWVTHSSALGSTNAHTLVNSRANGSLQLSGGIVIDEPLTLNGQRMPNYGYSLYSSAGSNTIRGAVTKVNEIRVNAAGGSTLVFSGGIQPSGGGGDMVVNAGGTIIFDTKPISLNGGFWSDNGGIAVIAVSNNTFTSLRTASGTVRTDVPQALPANVVLSVGVGYSPNGTFNLNGNDQTVGQLLTDTTVAGTRVVTSPKRATLTLNQSANTTYNGTFGGAVCLVKSGTGTFLVTNGTSTTAGDITVSNGTFIVAQSAGFSAISNMVVAGGTLELRTQTALPDTAALSVSGAGQVKVSSGLSETVGTLFLDGVQQMSGTWGAIGSGLAHEDAHFTGPGTLVVLSSPPVAAVSVTWDGGDAAGTLFSAPTNWVDDVLPVFDGTAHAIFATGGATATVDTAASLYGMTFNCDTNFVVAGGDGALALGAGGVAVKLPTTTTRTYRLEEDVTFVENQVWSVTNNGAGSATLVVSGALSDGNSLYTLTKSGNGALVLSGNNSYDGVTTVKTGGVLRITHANALGSTNGHTVAENGGWLEMSGGITVPESVALYGDASTSHQGVLRSTGGSNVLSGLVINGSRLKAIGGSGSLDIVGGVTGGQLVLGADSGSFIRVAEKPINIGGSTFFAHTASLIILAVSNNVWGQLEVSGNYVRTDVDNALAPAGMLNVGNGNPSGVNLNGHDQTVGQLVSTATSAGTRMIYSAAPATLTVTQNVNTTFGASLTGAVNLIKIGSGNLLLSGTNTAYGAYCVSNGALIVSGTGTLGVNSTNIVVGGAGTLVLSNSLAVADAAVVRMPAAGTGTAKISLASGVDERVGWLLYGDKVQRAGTYGSSDSNASHKDSTRFSGTGVLRVMHDNSGTLIVVQ